jgi:hypothetical protein
MSAGSLSDSTPPSLSRFIGHPVFRVLELVITIVGVVLAIYFYRASIIRPDLTYYVNPVRASVVKAGVFSRLSVFLDKTKLDSDVSAAQIALWNRGKQPIKRTQILKPVMLSVEGPAPILEASVRKVSRDIIKLDLGSVAAFTRHCLD